jgi:hypothetical protein
MPHTQNPTWLGLFSGQVHSFHGPDVAGPATTTNLSAAHPELARLLQWEGLAGGPAADEVMAEGRTNAAIAKSFVVTERAVEKHVANIFTKLGLTPSDTDHRRVLAVLRYLDGR